MNTNGQDTTKAHRLKIIVVTVIAFIIVLVVGIWAISTALGAAKKSEENKDAEVAAANEKAKEESANPTGTGAISPAEQYTATDVDASAQAVTPAPIPENNIPTTGPTDVVFSALMIGVVVFLIGLNINLVKENQ